MFPRFACTRFHFAGAVSATVPLALTVFAATAAAQVSDPTNFKVTTGTVLTEWDLNSMGDFVPGALTVDDRSSSKKSKVWFVTRGGTVRLYRLTPGLNMKKDGASATSWDLNALLTGGVRLRHSDDGRFAFVNVTTTDFVNEALVAIDTKDNSRITWADRPISDQMSDVTVDTRDGGWNVFTAAPAYCSPTSVSACDTGDFAQPGVVQRLRPGVPQLMNGQWVVPAEVTRFNVGFGVGTCLDAPSDGSPCIPGITVDRRRGHPIFVAEPDFGPNGAIGEIDPTPVRCPVLSGYSTCAKVRHWPLPAGAGAPRQIRVDDMGRLWGITSLGTLFSLEIMRNSDKAIVTVHDPVGPGVEFLFAVAPAGGVVGYTDTDNNKVSLLFPQMNGQPVTATTTIVPVMKKTIFGSRESITPVTQPIYPRVAVAGGQDYDKSGDGSYTETFISSAVMQSGTGSPAPSTSPTGMEADGNCRTGGFFYGVGLSGGMNRIGHLEVRIDKHRQLEWRKGDNDRDHDGIDDQNDDDVDGDAIANAFDTDNDNDGVPDVLDKDKNGDGIDDDYQTPGNHETERQDNGQMVPGDFREYEVSYDPHTVLLTAIVEADTLTAPLSVQIIDASGNVVLSAPTTLGKAIVTSTPTLPGLYTVRVMNAGATAIGYKTKLITSQVPY